MARAESVRERWEAAGSLLVAHRDVLEARPLDAEPPAPLVARGWDAWLAALSDARLAELEVRGLAASWPVDAPASLSALVAGARAVCDVASVAVSPGPARAPRPRENPRKQAQVDAFAALVGQVAAGASRVVDVGSGHGHLTRAVAGNLPLPVVGLERRRALTESAQRLSERSVGRAPVFVVADVIREGLSFAAGDCVIGLHTCGELGDAIVDAVARSDAHAVVLVGCCLQNRRDDWRVAFGSADPGLALPKALLGLSNLAAGDDGVEATRIENLAARERRFALHRLLTEAGAELQVGASLDGLNRRSAHAELAVLVARAFAARGLPLPTPAAIAEAARWAAGAHAASRRFAVPRSLLARALEVFVLLDRALWLEAHGFTVQAGTLFPPAVSARNLVLVGVRRPGVGLPGEAARVTQGNAVRGW